MIVFISHISIVGPMWKKIRGAGLAYHYNLSLMPHESLLYLTLYKATNVTAAFKETKIIIVSVKLSRTFNETTHLYEKIRRHSFSPMPFGIKHSWNQLKVHWFLRLSSVRNPLAIWLYSRYYQHLRWSRRTIIEYWWRYGSSIGLKSGLMFVQWRL